MNDKSDAISCMNHYENEIGREMREFDGRLEISVYSIRRVSEDIFTFARSNLRRDN